MNDDRYAGDLIDKLTQTVRAAEDSCGAGASAGKAGNDAGVEGLGAGTVVPDNRAKTAVNNAQSSGSESQHNCAGLGAEWGIPPAGIPFFVERPDRKLNAAILASCQALLLRSEAHLMLSDLPSAKRLLREIRAQQQEIRAYVTANFLWCEFAAALLSGARGSDVAAR